MEYWSWYDFIPISHEGGDPASEDGLLAYWALTCAAHCGASTFIDCWGGEQGWYRAWGDIVFGKCWGEDWPTDWGDLTEQLENWGVDWKGFKGCSPSN